MFEFCNPLAVGATVPGAEGIAELIAANRTTRMQGECELLILAALWADAHDPKSRIDPTERCRCWGGEGTPQVVEYAHDELGALLHTSGQTAAMLMADALDLRHRLPETWDRVKTGAICAFQARAVAQETRHLSSAAALVVDDTLAPHWGLLPWPRMRTLLEAAILDADPDLADARARAAEAERFVRAGRGTEHGLKLFVARATAGDVVYLMAMINRLADILRAEGDADPVEIRRATALGILANPAHALALLTRHARVGDAAADAAGADGVAASPGSWTRRGGAESAEGVAGSIATVPVGVAEGAGPAESAPRAGGTPPTGGASAVDPAGIRAEVDRSAPPGPDADLPSRPIGSSRLGPRPSELTEDPLRPRDDARAPARSADAHVDDVAQRSSVRLTPSDGPPEPDDAVPDVTSGDWVGPTGEPDPEGDDHRSVAIPGTKHPVAVDELERLGSIDPRRLAPVAVLHVHLTERALTEAPGHSTVVRMEGVGPVTLGQVRRFLDRSDLQIRIQPVLDPAEVAPVDAYEIPHRHREAVRLRHLVDTFPYSTCDSRAMDLDHTVAHGAGGPTSVGNLSPLTRHHHRAKTHGGWGKRQPEPDTVVWRSPHGWVFVVTPQGTMDLGRTSYAQAVWRAAVPTPKAAPRRARLELAT